MKWLSKIFARAIAIIIASYLLPGIEIKDFLNAVLLAVVLAILNSFLKPILIILTIPVTILSFGLFLLVINAAIILIADDLVSGFSVDGFWWALLFSLVMTAIMSIFNSTDQSAQNDKTKKH